MSDDLTARIVEATARAIVGADIMGSPEQARAALAAAVREAGVDADDLCDAALGLTPCCAPDEDTPGQASDRRAAALLRALAEIADA